MVDRSKLLESDTKTTVTEVTETTFVLKNQNGRTVGAGSRKETRVDGFISESSESIQWVIHPSVGYAMPHED